MRTISNKLRSKKDVRLDMIIGLDGFVDSVVQVVDKRYGYANFTPISTISEFGGRISRAAGLSTNVEMVPLYEKLGGNGPILANALLEYGVNLTYFGALGKPEIHSVFMPLVEKAKAVYSLCNPGLSDACEFGDGKIIIGKHAYLRDLTWGVMKDAMGGAKGIADKINACQLLGMENWVMMPHMSAIWEGMLEEVFPHVESRDVKPLAFFDLADPEKRTDSDIKHAMGLISRFEEKFRVVLGLNGKEAFQIAKVLGVPIGERATDGERLEAVTRGICSGMGIFCAAVHPTRSACCAMGEGYYTVEGPYCEKPKLTTGAGDNFNAGFCLALALDFSPEEALTLGVATSGYYVRNAESPGLVQVAEFLEKWEAGEL
ncbi:MAG: PfkB family carbohydrate kinase [Oscillospiraceae bacterium]|nr:PfkB family carbohydrate kinase [Oscillospiraceae bacterium]